MFAPTNLSFDGHAKEYVAIVLYDYARGGTTIAKRDASGNLYGCREVAAGGQHDAIVESWCDQALPVEDLRAKTHFSKRTEYPDITGQIYQLYGKEPELLLPGQSAISMYSFDRPAYLLWQSVFEGLLDRGWTQEEAIAWLQSKGPRHLLDQHDDALRKIGSEYAKLADKSYIE